MNENNKEIEEEIIRMEQLVILYEKAIDETYQQHYTYKRVYAYLKGQYNKSIIQDIMKSKIYQRQWLIDIHDDLATKKYLVKKTDIKKIVNIREIFAKECNYQDAINHLFINTTQQERKLKIVQVFNEEQQCINRLLYLQSLIGSDWQADNK